MQTVKQHRTLRHAVVIATLAGAFLSQGTWALAATTGNIAGSVKDSKGAPVAGVRVAATAPSQTASAVTDAGGHFILLSLAPDTYTISLTKAGYQPVSFAGVTVFADQTQQVAYVIQSALKVIARVTSAAGVSLVKSGVGGDLYSINANQASAAAALGGGGNLNNAYSAMATVPGVQTSQGGLGWDFNGAYVRGQNAYYTGYEYDGIPVNRAFDNYNSSTESTLGLQELQVYTGGGPSSVATSGTAGFINQVIKTGTFPGFATANFGVATPQFYHQAQVEIGGSTPDRNFSYYVGLMGYNQAYRFFDSTNGAGYMTPGGPFSGNPLGFGTGYGFGSYQLLNVGFTCLSGTCQGDKGICKMYNAAAAFSVPAQGCWQFYSGVAGTPSFITDRENVVNVHVGIPKSNGLRDDVQLMWSGSALNNYGYNDPTSIGTSYNQFLWAQYNTLARTPDCSRHTIAPGLTIPACNNPGYWGGNAFCYPNCGQVVSLAGAIPCSQTSPSGQIGCSYTYTPYADNIAYNVPFGAVIARNSGSVTPPGVYMAPGTPPHTFGGPQSPTDQSLSVNQNDTGIIKMQYTHALSQSAYLRAYAYTFYSDWYQNNPLLASCDNFCPNTYGAALYQLITHTAGGALDFQDQLNDQNLVRLDTNYTTAGVIRFNDTSAYAGCASGYFGFPNICSPIGYMASNGHGGYNCYDPAKGTPEICLSAPSYCVSAIVSGKPTCTTTASTWTTYAASGPSGFAPAGSPAAKAGATWDSLWAGNAAGSYNTVRPRFTNASLQDQFRPSDRLLINAAIRYDDFTYDLPDSLTAANAFYANMSANYTCVLASTNQVLTEKLLPGQAPPAPAQYVSGDCNTAATALFPAGPHTGWVHPNGTVQDGVTAPNFSANSPNSYTLNYWEPRFSGTYTLNADNVVRMSAGRFTQPPISASVQYLSLTGDDRSVWNSTMNLGFYSPFHPIPGISSGQYDMSWESRLKGTDMSFKLSPFYTWVSNWQQQTFIGSAFVTQVPVGVNRNEGVEFQFNKGDFSKNGLSGLVTATYTSSKIMFQNVPTSTGGVVPNELIALNQAITAYNQLTKGGGGSPCYQFGVGVPCSERNNKIQKGYDTILNPYYNLSEQGLLDTGGWYNPYTTAIAPNLNGAVDSYISPWVSALILNYRHDKLAITPSINFQSGGFYGSPLDTEGLDPRTCVTNSRASGITKLSPATNPLKCNYLSITAPGLGQFSYLYVPNPQTGTFLFDNVEQPNSMVGNLQVTYDLTPRIRLSVLGVNLFRACFGGSAMPWTAAFPPSNVYCGYLPQGGSLNSTIYPGNFYNGTGINDVKANGGVRVPAAFQQSYLPTGATNGGLGAAPSPINVYFNAQVRI